MSLIMQPLVLKKELCEQLEFMRIRWFIKRLANTAATNSRMAREIGSKIRLRIVVLDNPLFECW